MPTEPRPVVADLCHAPLNLNGFLDVDRSRHKAHGAIEREVRCVRSVCWSSSSAPGSLES